MTKPVFVRPGRFQRPEWTELAVVLGPNLRWVENDYDDLQTYAPEVLLGYRVALSTPGSHLRGYQVHKLVILDGIQRERAWMRAYEEARSQLIPGKHPEWYRVHRGLNPVVKRV